MYIQNSVEINGATGKTYTFDLYPKSSQLPETRGIYILMYCHPRGHLAGIEFNPLRIGIADNLNSIVASFRRDETMSGNSWNYTGIIVLENNDIGLEYLTDLTNNIPAHGATLPAGHMKRMTELNK
jgi:hypothetical protein